MIGFSPRHAEKVMPRKAISAPAGTVFRPPPVARPRPHYRIVDRQRMPFGNRVAGAEGSIWEGRPCEVDVKYGVPERVVVPSW